MGFVKSQIQGDGETEFPSSLPNTGWTGLRPVSLCVHGDSASSFLPFYTVTSAKLESHEGEHFEDQPSHSGGASSYHHHRHHHHHDDGPFDDYKGGFSADAHHNHHSDNYYSNHNLSNHDYHHNSNHHYHHQQNYGSNYRHHNYQFESNDHGSDQSVPRPGRKRGFFRSAQGSFPDYADGGCFAKLYVAFVPRTAIEEDIRPLFEEFGNIVEVVLIKDKRTGHQQGSCFVKYTTIEEAERAIIALNERYTFPGEVTPVKVRFAEGERERLGTLEHRLYVGGFNKQASRNDIEEIFSPYGFVEDVYMVRDERKQNRGYGFIKFSHRHMALAAIRALHGAHTMRGCDRPLIVRFADPKKPRNAESRDTSSFGRSNLGPHPQELFVRSAPDFSDLSDRNVLPNIFHPQISTSSQAEAVPQSQNQQPAAPSVMQKPFHLLEKSPSELPQVPSKQLQFLQESSQSQAVPEMQTQLHLIQPSTESSEQQQDSQVTMKKQSPQIGSNSQAVFRDSTPSAVVASSTTAVASAVLEKALTVDPPDCDWSEHICPDGYKYYYNCVTCESRWEKPEEFVLFEQKLQKLQHLLKPPSQQLESLPHPPSHFIPQVSRTQEFVRGPATATPIIDPACVH